MEDGYWKLKEKGTTSRRVESLDIWTCREADNLKKILLYKPEQFIMFSKYVIWAKRII